MCPHLPPPTGMPGGDRGPAAKFSYRDVRGGGLIAGTPWVIGIEYNALLWAEVIEVAYLCAGSLADYLSIIAK